MKSSYASTYEFNDYFAKLDNFVTLTFTRLNILDNKDGVMSFRSFIAFYSLMPGVLNSTFYAIEHFRKIRYLPLAKFKFIHSFTNFIHTKK